MNQFIFKIILFSALLFCSSLTASAEIIDQIIAKVNNDIITLSELDEKAISLAMEKKMDRNNSQDIILPKEQELLQMMIDEILQLQYAKKIGITVNDQYVYSAIDDIKERNSLTDEMFKKLLAQEHILFEDYFQKIKDQMMLSRVMNRELKSRILIDKEEINNYYQEHLEQYLLPESINVRHILFLTTDKTEDVLTQIKQKAESVLEEVRNGADFIDMIKRYSEDPNAKEGGETDFFTRGMMVPEFEKTAFSLQSGEISDVIKTKFGFHIIKAIEKRVKRPIRLEEVQEDIKNTLFQQKVKKKYTQWIEELRNNSYIDKTEIF